MFTLWKASAAFCNVLSRSCEETDFVQQSTNSTHRTSCSIHSCWSLPRRSLEAAAARCRCQCRCRQFYFYSWCRVDSWRNSFNSISSSLRRKGTKINFQIRVELLFTLFNSRNALALVTMCGDVPLSLFAAEHNLFSNACGVCVKEIFLHQRTTLMVNVEKLENARMYRVRRERRFLRWERGWTFHDKLISDTRNEYKHFSLPSSCATTTKTSS